MSSETTGAASLNLPLSQEERSELLHLLENLLGETRVELHHTHTPDFRDRVLRQEALLRGLIDRLRQLHS